jgi:hypothetical protein
MVSRAVSEPDAANCAVRSGNREGGRLGAIAATWLVGSSSPISSQIVAAEARDPSSA